MYTGYIYIDREREIDRTLQNSGTYEFTILFNEQRAFTDCLHKHIHSVTLGKSVTNVEQCLSQLKVQIPCSTSPFDFCQYPFLQNFSPTQWPARTTYHAHACMHTFEKVRFSRTVTDPCNRPNALSVLSKMHILNILKFKKHGKKVCMDTSKLSKL